MKTFSLNMRSLIVVLVIAGLVYTFGVGHPVVVLVQNVISPIA